MLIAPVDVKVRTQWENLMNFIRISTKSGWLQNGKNVYWYFSVLVSILLNIHISKYISGPGSLIKIQRRILEMLKFLFSFGPLIKIWDWYSYSWFVQLADNANDLRSPPVVIGLQCTLRHCEWSNDPFISFPSIGNSITKSFILHHSQKSARPID